ncbi:MAG: pentapeptide repeat-containing protein [Aggregatilineales bacterium]
MNDEFNPLGDLDKDLDNLGRTIDDTIDRAMNPAGKRKRKDKRKRQPGMGMPPVPPIPPVPPAPPSMQMGRIEFFTDSNWDEETLRDLTRLHRAVQSLRKSVTHALMHHNVGAADKVRERYESLFEKAKTLFEDDDYFAELFIAVDTDASQTNQMEQLSFGLEQLAGYLEDIVKEVRRAGYSYSTGDMGANMGKQIRDQVLSMTKGIIQRAMSNVTVEYDFDIDGQRYSNRDGQNLAGADLSDQDLSEENFEDANLMGANLSNSQFAHANLENANLTGAILTHAHFNNANLEGAVMSGAQGQGTQFIDANLEDASLTGASLQNAVFRGANLEDASLKGANLNNAHFEDANIQDANFTGANLSGAIMRGVNASDARFVTTNLSGADLSDARLVDAVFKHANLSGTNLRGTNLEDATLTGANLNGADMTDAHLEDVILPDGRRYRHGDDLSEFGAVDSHYEGKLKRSQSRARKSIYWSPQMAFFRSMGRS